MATQNIEQLSNLAETSLAAYGLFDQDAYKARRLG